jgi:hypothetical protein
MLAEICKTIPSEYYINNENMLTANVFGSMKYLPPNILLLPFLDRAINFTGSSITALKDWVKIRKKIKTVQYYFWPKLSNKKIPDLILHFYDAKNNLISCAVVENKYYSPKNNKNGEDQLDNYYSEIKKGGFFKYLDHKAIIPVSDKCLKLLFYITLHSQVPKEFIESIDSSKMPINEHLYFWLSWADVHHCVVDSLKSFNLPFESMALLNDLLILLNQKGFNMFFGWDSINEFLVQINSKYSSILLDIFPKSFYFDYLKFFDQYFNSFKCLLSNNSIFFKDNTIDPNC